MQSFIPIDVAQAVEKIKNQGATLVDIRDQNTFDAGHVPNSFHLTDGTLSKLVNEIAPETPLIIMCYHGISSQRVANYLLTQGFEEVYNLEGGFAAWQKTQTIIQSNP